MVLFYCHGVEVKNKGISVVAQLDELNCASSSQGTLEIYSQSFTFQNNFAIFDQRTPIIDVNWLLLFHLNLPLCEKLIVLGNIHRLFHIAFADGAGLLQERIILLFFDDELMNWKAQEVVIFKDQIGFWLIDNVSIVYFYLFWQKGEKITPSK